MDVMTIWVISGIGVGVSLTPRILAWATLEDSTITWERKKGEVVSIVCLSGCWLIDWLYLINFLEKKVMFISCKHKC